MPKPKAINRKKLVAFGLPIIRKEKLPKSEELEKLRQKQYVAERKLTTAKNKRPSSGQDKSVVAIRRFFVARKRQTAAFDWLAVKDTAVKTKPLISKENAKNRPETIQRGQVLGVSAFREQIGN